MLAAVIPALAATRDLLARLVAPHAHVHVAEKIAPQTRQAVMPVAAPPMARAMLAALWAAAAAPALPVLAERQVSRPHVALGPVPAPRGSAPVEQSAPALGKPAPQLENVSLLAECC